MTTAQQARLRAPLVALACRWGVMDACGGGVMLWRASEGCQGAASDRACSSLFPPHACPLAATKMSWTAPNVIVFREQNNHGEY